MPGAIVRHSHAPTEHDFPRGQRGAQMVFGPNAFLRRFYYMKAVIKWL